MAYTRRRKPARYHRGAGSRRNNHAGDSFAGVTIVQILITLCVISGLYFATLSDGKVAVYIRSEAKEAMNTRWTADEIMEVMGGLGDITPLRDMTDYYFSGRNDEDAGPAVGDNRSAEDLGAAIFTGGLQPDEPLEELPPIADSSMDTLPETPNEDHAGDEDEAEPAEITAGTEEEPLGSGGMLRMDEGTFTPPEGVVTGPVYLSVKLKTPTAGKVTSPFGFRTHPITDKWDFHTGVDIAADKGTDILAALQGTVAEVGTSAIYGKYIIVDHGGNVMTGYSHCDKIIAEEGQRVAMGARIATVGSTGISTGPHLHFELIVDGQKADPLPHLRTAVVG